MVAYQMGDIGDPQVFQLERVVVAHQIERHVAVEVLARSSHRLGPLRQRFACGISAVTALLRASHALLGPFALLRGLSVAPGMLTAFPRLP